MPASLAKASVAVAPSKVVSFTSTVRGALAASASFFAAASAARKVANVATSSSRASASLPSNGAPTDLRLSSVRPSFQFSAIVLMSAGLAEKSVRSTHEAASPSRCALKSVRIAKA